MSLSTKILVFMLAGLVVGTFLQWLPESEFVNDYLIDGLFGIVGTLFIKALKMLMVPLVLVSLIVGTSSLTDPSKLGRLSIKTLGLYLATTAIAISAALALALVFKPGSGLDLSEATFTPAEKPPLSEIITNLVPENPILAMAEANMLQIIMFAVLFGYAITRAGQPGVRIGKFFSDVNEVIMKLVMVIMRLAPYGVFCLIAKVFATFPFDELIQSLGGYFLLVIGVLLLHGLVTYPVLLKLLGGLNPVTFLKKMWATQVFAFSTSSSNATLPVTLRTVEKRLGVDNSVASFTIPLGATINMDGTAIMQGIATIFIAQAYSVDLTMAQLLTVVLTATLASIGTAGVPSVGLIMLAGVLAQVGLPVEAIGFILGIDRLLDMTRTAVNITGDAAVTCIVGKSEGALDYETFNDPDAGMIEEST